MNINIWQQCYYKYVTLMYKNYKSENQTDINVWWDVGR